VEDRLSELADFRKIHGHCNVPKHYSEKHPVVSWVSKQRTNYKLYRQRKASPPMTLTLRIQALKALGFGPDGLGTTWEDRLSEFIWTIATGTAMFLSNYRQRNIQLGYWVESDQLHAN
jgi:hypothetical protein